MQNPQEYQLSKYRLLNLIGKGAFSYVYLAEQNRVNFLKEAEIAGRLVHPNIVRMFDGGVEGDVFYLAMEYAENGSMRKRYPKGSHVAPSDVVKYVHQAADALQYAHDQYIIHRDIKPENMLLGPQEELWLSDFGLSLKMPVTHSLSLQGLAGTLYYMAPEQARGKPRPVSDQYSLAVVAYEWLCGRRPFQGSYMEVLNQVLSAPVPSLHAINPIVSSAVEEVVLKALAKEPHERFASVQAFAQALDDASNEPPTVLSLHPEPPKTLSMQQATTVPPIQVPPVSPAQASLTSPAQASPMLPPQVPPIAPAQASPTLSTQAPPVVPILAPPVGPVNTVPPSPVAPSTPTRPWHPSRRTVVRTTLSFVVVVGAGIAVFEWKPFKGSNAQHSAKPTPTARPTPMPFPPGTTLFTYKKHVDEVKSVAWSPDSTRIASAGADSDETVRLWDALNGGNELVYQGHERETLPPTFKGNPVKAALWSPDGMYIASSDEAGKVRVWQAKTGRDLPVSPYSGHKGPVRSLAWSHDGRFLASGGEDNQVQVWDVQKGQHLFTFTRHNSPVFGVAWSYDDIYIASGSGDKNSLLTTGDNTVYVWKAANGQLVKAYKGHTRTVRSVAWSPTASNLIASACEDRTIRVWDAFTGELFYTLSIGGNGPSKGVEAISWSPDGSMIAAAYDGQPSIVGQPLVVVWKVVDRTQVLKYTGHKKGLWSVAWSPDGRLIVSGSMDHSAQVWTAPQSQ